MDLDEAIQEVYKECEEAHIEEHGTIIAHEDSEGNEVGGFECAPEDCIDCKPCEIAYRLVTYPTSYQCESLLSEVLGLLQGG